jgi:DNA-binding beta-propeller fold protein YncE
VVNAATLRAGASLRSIAPPYAVVVRGNGQPMILNENSNAMVLVDTQAAAATIRFPVGDAPGAAVMMAGKLFVPEVANMAVQESPLAPVAVKPIDTGLIAISTAVGLGNKVYANSGSSVRVIDPGRERATRSILLRTGSIGLGSALTLAASGDGRSLLASYLVLAIDGGPTDAGIIKLDTVTGVQRLLSSLPFVPGNIVASADGLAAYGVGILQGGVVGRWDLATQRFSASRTLPGNPVYVDLAVSRDGSQLLLVDQKGKVDFVDAATLQLITSVAAGPKPSAIAISGDGRSAVVTDSQSPSVTVLDVPNRRSIGGVAVGAPSSGAVFID